jgi:hypothetical protein
METKELTLTELDTIRANEMHHYLNPEGCQEIWKYDIITRKQALKEAICNQNYDNMEHDSDNSKKYALVGCGIDDCLFNTVDELKELVKWLCTGYLGCYLKPEFKNLARYK